LYGYQYPLAIAMFRRGARSAAAGRCRGGRWVDARARSAAEAGVAGASSHW
jgi:hypothetical protein